MPYKDPKNPKNIAYKKAYYVANKDTIWAYHNRKSSSDKWRKENRGKVQEYARVRRNQKGDTLREKCRVYYNENKTSLQKKSRVKTELLTDGYMRKHLLKHGYSKDDIRKHPEILETYRLIIKMKRLCKTSKN
jgi:hypothetical protein